MDAAGGMVSMTSTILLSLAAVILTAAILFAGYAIHRQRSTWHPPSWWSRPVDTHGLRTSLWTGDEMPTVDCRRMVDNVKRRRK